MSIEKDWNFLFEVLCESIANIRKEYFEVQRYKGDAALRERVYCYELYHQLRMQLPEAFPYLLHGEIDKRGHDWISEFFGGSSPNPDFVIHVPGSPKNLAVIEVKTTANSKAEIQSDITKLVTFVTSVGYHRGILLLFGPDEIENIRIPNRKIVSMWHREPGQGPKITDWY